MGPPEPLPEVKKGWTCDGKRLCLFFCTLALVDYPRLWVSIPTRVVLLTHIGGEGASPMWVSISDKDFVQGNHAFRVKEPCVCRKGSLCFLFETPLGNSRILPESVSIFGRFLK